MTNAPYNGVTHIPVVSVLTTVFREHEHASPGNAGGRPLFYVASRGHHSEIGGITPGSMPPFSRSIEDEGILIDNFKLVDSGNLREKETIQLFLNHKYPSRSIDKVERLRSQIAANTADIVELHKMVWISLIRCSIHGTRKIMQKKLLDALLTLLKMVNLDMKGDEDGTPYVQVKVTVDKGEDCYNRLYWNSITATYKF